MPRTTLDHKVSVPLVYRHVSSPPPSSTPAPKPLQQEHARELTQLYSDRPSIQACGRGVAVLANGERRVLRCGNKWACPTCSFELLGRDRDEILRVLDASPGVVFTTFTMSHNGPLADSLGALLDVWTSAFTTGSWMSRFAKRTGSRGWVRAVEITFHEATEHPHIHAVFVFDRAPAAAVEAELQARWEHIATGFGFAVDRAAWQQHRLPAVVPRGEARARVAAYLTKQTARWRSKTGDGRSPGDLLDGVSRGYPDDLDRLLEFHEATKGRRKVATSRWFRPGRRPE